MYKGVLLGLDKSAIINQAQKFAAKGQLDKAVEEWQKLIQETPNDGNIFNTIGDLQLKKAASAKAVQAYMKAAEAFQTGGFELKAIAVYKKIIKIDPARLDVCEMLADLNSSRGLIANATDEYYRVAKQYAKLGNIKGALQIYQKVADLEPNNVHARLKLAETCRKEGYNDHALEAYCKALQFFRSRHQNHEAESVLKQIREMNPDFLERNEALSESKVDAASAPPVAQGVEAPVKEESSPALNLEEIVPALLAASNPPAPEAQHAAGEMPSEPSKDPADWGNISLHPLASGGEAPERSELGGAPSEAPIVSGEPATQTPTKEPLVPSPPPSISFDLSDPAPIVAAEAPEEPLISMAPPSSSSDSITPVIPEGPLAGEPAAAAPLVAASLDSVTPEFSLPSFASDESAPPAPAVQSFDSLTPKPNPVQPRSDESAPPEPVASLSPEEIQNRLTEANVYLKYGLIEKAHDQFLEVVKFAPDHAEAYLQLKEIYKKQGAIEKAAQICGTLAALYRQRGDTDRQSEIEQEMNGLVKAAAELSGSGGGQVEASEIEESQAVRAQSGCTERTIEDSSAGQSLGLDPFAEQLKKADEYLKRNRVKDARRILIKVLDVDPDHVHARRKLLEIEDQEISQREYQDQASAENRGQSVREESKAPEVLREVSFEDLLQSVEESFSEHSVDLSQGQHSKPRASFKDMAKDLSKPPEGEAYFDLTSLLEEFDDKNKEVPPAPPSEVENQLDAIFKEFQRGMNDDPHQEDVETHFNLGIAYNEMGLLDDAINEFKQAMSGERSIDAALMLALCYQKKGNLRDSEHLLRVLIKEPRCSNQQQLLLKYELAVILSQRPGNGEAQRLFSEIFSQDPTFRDVASRVANQSNAGRSGPSEAKKKKISSL